MSSPDPERIPASDDAAEPHVMKNSGEIPAGPAPQEPSDEARALAESARIEKVMIAWLRRGLAFLLLIGLLLYSLFRDPRAGTGRAKDAEAGNEWAQLRLATDYLEGISGRRDYDKAAEYMKKAGRLGNTIAMTNVGIMYETGTGVSKDDENAARWFESAARKGDPEAQVHLGTMYLEGRGVPKDEAKAVEWYRKAATAPNYPKMGDIAGMLYLGTMYLEGKGVPKDAVKAMEWYRKAVDGSLPRSVAMEDLPGRIAHRPAARRYRLLNPEAKAALNLGIMYEQGKDIPRDVVLAYQWFCEAAARGSKEGGAKRSELRKSLTKEQLKQAGGTSDEEIEEFRRKHPKP